MIHKKMLITLSVATIAAAGMGGYLLTPVFAQNSTNNTVFDMVVQKLDLQNVSGSQLKDAFESSRKDFHVSKQSAKIDEAELKSNKTKILFKDMVINLTLLLTSFKNAELKSSSRKKHES